MGCAVIITYRYNARCKQIISIYDSLIIRLREVFGHAWSH